MSETKILEWTQECKVCGGTGIYSGMAEHDGIGVVCSGCKGTGEQQRHEEYRPFRGKNYRKNIKWVLQTNPGIAVGLAEGW